jgi:ABC-type transport system involved in cytochrome bd biosynthesis fused ATPase/permease subunit
MEEDARMGSPSITLRCDCGADGRSGYGERWACPACGREYDTAQIPQAEYDAIATLDRNYRRASQAMMVVLALIVLVVAITGQLISIFAGLAVVMLSWFIFIKPIVHRRHKRAVSELTRRWELTAE